MIPLLTIDLAGFPLRVYASPLDVPDHPWASFADLMHMADVVVTELGPCPTKLRRDLPHMIHDFPNGTVIVAEPMVTGVFLAWELIGCENALDTLNQWTRAWTELFAVQLARLPGDEWKQAACEAKLRNTPHMPGTVVLQ